MIINEALTFILLLACNLFAESALDEDKAQIEVGKCSYSYLEYYLQSKENS
jgi:hypothetical protein